MFLLDRKDHEESDPKFIAHKRILMLKKDNFWIQNGLHLQAGHWLIQTYTVKTPFSQWESFEFNVQIKNRTTRATKFHLEWYSNVAMASVFIELLSIVHSKCVRSSHRKWLLLIVGWFFIYWFIRRNMNENTNETDHFL